MAEPELVRRAASAAAALAFACLAGGAAAQTMNANPSSYNGGYGRANGSQNRGVDFGTRDQNGNRVIVDGLIQMGVDQSTISRSDSTFFPDSGVGTQTGANTAIGNNLVVITQGNFNTVIVNSHQVNNGNISAGTTLNGGVSNGP
jgi:holdfast attachment protein HfaA